MFSYAVFFSKYAIEDGERPDSLLVSIWNPFYDWVILLTNNMVNVQYDWPMTNYQIGKVLSQNMMMHTVHTHYETKR